MSKTRVANVAFSPGFVEFSWMVEPDDIVDAGNLIAQHSYTVRMDHPLYGDAIKQLVEDLEALVDDIREDWSDKEAFVPAEPDDDDDDD